MTMAEVKQELRRRGFRERYRIAWETNRGDGNWVLLGPPRKAGIRDGRLVGTVYAPYSDDEMDFWTARSHAIFVLKQEFSSLVIEHRVMGEAWGHIPNEDFEAFATRLGIRKKTRRVLGQNPFSAKKRPNSRPSEDESSRGRVETPVEP